MTKANFLEADTPPPTTLDIDLTSPARFVNRELSWLQFNWRVLEEAENPNVPLLERLRFLSISATNLDEFYTVRVAGLRELAIEGNTTPGLDGLSPAEQLVVIDQDARALMSRQQTVFETLQTEMAQENIQLLHRADLSKADIAYLEDVFIEQVFPVLSPLAIDPAHPFPFLPNEGFALALQLERPSDKRQLRSLLPVPAQIDRFIALPAETGHRFLPLEELLLLHIARLFPGYQVKGSCAFKVLR
ncbi:MAG: RNA degradosome polyphosphate kinase, partial [Pseudomonadota bacterium]